jgi:hypothetical protein
VKSSWRGTALLFQVLFCNELNASKDLKTAHEMLEELSEYFYILDLNGLSTYSSSKQTKLKIHLTV